MNKNPSFASIFPDGVPPAFNDIFIDDADNYQAKPIFLDAHNLLISEKIMDMLEKDDQYLYYPTIYNSKTGEKLSGLSQYIFPCSQFSVFNVLDVEPLGRFPMQECTTNYPYFFPENKHSPRHGFFILENILYVMSFEKRFTFLKFDIKEGGNLELSKKIELDFHCECFQFNTIKFFGRYYCIFYNETQCHILRLENEITIETVDSLPLIPLTKRTPDCSQLDYVQRTGLLFLKKDLTHYCVYNISDKKFYPIYPKSVNKKTISSEHLLFETDAIKLCYDDTIKRYLLGCSPFVMILSEFVHFNSPETLGIVYHAERRGESIILTGKILDNTYKAIITYDFTNLFPIVPNLDTLYEIIHTAALCTNPHIYFVSTPIQESNTIKTQVFFHKDMKCWNFTCVLFPEYFYPREK